jgi:hypothetical protein
MKTLFALLMISTLACSTAASQVTLNGVTMPATLSVGESHLKLNGGGVRTKLIFKLYTAGLYLDAKSADAAAIVQADKAMAVRLVITSNKINSSNMSEAINEGFDKSTGGQTEKIRSRIDELLKTFTSEGIEVGDVFNITYVPGQGVLTYKNDSLKSTIKGLDFKQALFGIWLSDDPVSSGLKSGMLGN